MPLASERLHNIWIIVSAITHARSSQVKNLSLKDSTLLPILSTEFGLLQMLNLHIRFTLCDSGLLMVGDVLATAIRCYRHRHATAITRYTSSNCLEGFGRGLEPVMDFIVDQFARNGSVAIVQGTACSHRSETEAAFTGGKKAATLRLLSNIARTPSTPKKHQPEVFSLGRKYLEGGNGVNPRQASTSYVPAMMYDPTSSRQQQSFAQRKESLKNQNTPHQFALLTFNGAEILRLSNFPPNAIASLRTLFQEQLVYRADREDPEMGVSELIMADRLWSSKNVKYEVLGPAGTIANPLPFRTERLMTLIFSVILSHRFRFVTTLAYGRLAQDTRPLVFSKAVPGSLEVASSFRINLPAVTSSSLPMSSGSTGEGARPEQGTCFALSLTQKSLPVICTPKSSTPAILVS
ncbi:hypothetical protein M407DRAFT_32854, partial [Tulasnella calospora MUT 4182]